jgi:D-alanine-D-alanine ligase
MQALQILMLLGGESAERDVSLASGKACANGLLELGHSLRLLDPWKSSTAREFSEFDFGNGPNSQAPEPGLVDFDFNSALVDCLKKESPQVVFNCLHGGFGEDGRLAALLEMLQIQQTASPSLAMGLAMDKSRSKSLMAVAGLNTAPWILLSQYADNVQAQWDPVRPVAHLKSTRFSAPELIDQFGLPLIVKPNRMGSSVGITLATDKKSLLEAIRIVRGLGDDVLVEKYIDGRELTVSCLDGQTMPIVEISTREGWYDYSHKYSGGTDYTYPKNLESMAKQQMLTGSSAFYELLGCRGICRCDFRLDAQNRAWCLEMNTTPGMTRNSLVPKSAKAAGLDFNALLTKILQSTIG